MQSIIQSEHLAPIGLSTYARLSHLQRTIAALQANELAGQSELFVFSDAPKPGDEEKVRQVREYLHTVGGFRSVHIVERTENSRVRNNRDGIRMLLAEYGKMIFLEEDVITAPSFLAYMNDALESCRDDQRIFAINGYTPPLDIPADYRAQALLMPRFCAWGFGIWQDRFQQIEMDISPEMYRSITLDREQRAEYARGGNEALTQLYLESHGFVDALDIKIDYTMYIRGKKNVLCPIQSLTHTTGCDGSGEHWNKATERHAVALGEYRGDLDPAAIQLDARIIAGLKKHFALNVKGRLAFALMELGLYPYWRKLKRYLKR